MKKNNYKIRYLPSYIGDLMGILNYITYNLQNPKTAEKLLNKITEAMNKRSLSPLGYEKYNRTKNSKYIWYRIYIENYTVFYTVIEDTMEIVRILSSKRNFEKLI